MHQAYANNVIDKQIINKGVEQRLFKLLLFNNKADKENTKKKKKIK